MRRAPSSSVRTRPTRSRWRTSIAFTGFWTAPSGSAGSRASGESSSRSSDSKFGVSLAAQARSLNQSERLFYADPRVKAISQFELYDAPEVRKQDVYNTGLRLVDGPKKPSWTAFQMPLVATRLGANSVELWGAARPAPGRARVTITASPPSGGRSRMVASTVTRPNGYYRIRVSARNAATRRYRARWTDLSGDVLASRIASPGRRIAYKPLR
jgi:hypothetical protein